MENLDKREKTQLKSQKTQVSAILQEMERQKSVHKKSLSTSSTIRKKEEVHGWVYYGIWKLCAYRAS